MSAVIRILEHWWVLRGKPAVKINYGWSKPGADLLAVCTTKEAALAAQRLVDLQEDKP